MPEVVELRVHGVGGGSPESLLGVEEPETVRVAGEGPTGFWARRSQRSVEGYWWGRLTSAPLLQPLWIVLLPFTLLNVAGWMHQPLDERTTPTRSWWAVRWVLLTLGYLLTAVYAAWSGLLVVDLLLIEWQLGGRWDYATAGLAALAAVVALGVVFLVARHVQGGFERRRPPQGVVEASDQLSEAPTDDPRARFAGERDLAAPSFWMHGSSAHRMLISHTVVAAVVLLAPCVRAVLRLASGAAAGLGPLGYDVLIWWLLRAVVVALVVLALLTVVERVVFERARRRAPDRYVMTTRSGFRVCAQAVAVTFAVALAVGGFSGIERLLRTRIGAQESANRDLDIAFGVAAIVFALVVVWRLIVHARRKAQVRAELLATAAERVDDGRRQVSAAMLNRVAWARSLSDVLRNIDLVLSVPALCFLATSVVAVTGVTTRVPWGDQIAALGGTIILLSMSTILVFLWREGRRTGVRRQVGMIWDVLTFWPRRTHPWAIRPYSERAVPELQERLGDHLDRDRYIIVSAHSQGTVLAVAALAQLMDVDARAPGRIVLVTYGSPVAQLYQRFFPAYFHQPLAFDLHRQLSHGGISSDMAWRNFFRATDYVGKALFTGTGLAATVDRKLHDPAVQPVIDELPLADVVAGGPDPIREAFSALALHSDYNGEIELRAWVDELRLHLGGGHPDAADTVGKVMSPR